MIGNDNSDLLMAEEENRFLRLQLKEREREVESLNNILKEIEIELKNIMREMLS